MRIGLQLGLVCLLTAVAAGRARAVCAEPESCVCQRFPKQHVLRGRIASLEGSRAAVEVLAPLVNASKFAVKPGATIAGRLDQTSTSACGVPDAAFAPGDEVLALWQGPVEDALLDCFAFISCSSLQCDAAGPGDAPDESCHQTCLEESLDECPDTFDRSRLVLIPWADTLNLGQGRELPSDQAAVLGQQASCLSLFPAPPPGPCEDVILVPYNEGCGVAGSRGVSDATWCALLLLWAARRKAGASRRSAA